MYYRDRGDVSSASTTTAERPLKSTTALLLRDREDVSSESTTTADRPLKSTTALLLFSLHFFALRLAV